MEHNVEKKFNLNHFAIKFLLVCFMVPALQHAFWLKKRPFVTCATSRLFYYLLFRTTFITFIVNPCYT